MIKKLLLTAAALAITTSVFAARTDISARVISVKTPVVDNAITHNGATEVFMDLINKSNKPQEIIAAYSPIAGKTQLHKTTDHHGKMGMKQIPDIMIPRHSDEDLHLGGLHVMLMDLKQKLAKNEIIPIILIFKDGSWIDVNAKVS